METLQQIGYRCQTGKSTMPTVPTIFGTYLDIYDRFFSPRRNEPLNLLEIGVFGGASLQMWRAYFPNATIIALDVDPACAARACNGTTVKICDASDKAAIDSALGDMTFDIIIDDGSHVNTITKASFDALWPRMRSKGIYCVEDLHCSYWDLRDHIRSWPGMQHNKPGTNYVNERSLLNDLFMEQVRKMDGSEGNSDVASVQFFCDMCFIFRS